MSPHGLLMAEMEVLRVKFDVLQATMKYEMNTALDERCIVGSKFHTNNVINATKGSKRRIVSTLEMQSNAMGLSEDNSIRLFIRKITNRNIF